MEILLVYENEVNATKTAKFLKKMHIRKIMPRNIFIHYSAGNKCASKTALIVRTVIGNKVLYEDEFLINKIFHLLREDNSERRDIFIANSYEIKSILNFLELNHDIGFDIYDVEKGSVISILVNDKNKEAKKIFIP